MMDMLKKIFGSKNEREIRRIRSIVARINELEDSVKAIPDEAFPARTAAFRERLASGETLDALLPEAFATIREAARRVRGERHFDVQLVGGIVLHEGKIAEMKTGEGKTLTATAPVYLNALTGKGAHVVTVNDYLATRDADTIRLRAELFAEDGSAHVAGEASGAVGDAALAERLAADLLARAPASVRRLFAA